MRYGDFLRSIFQIRSVARRTTIGPSDVGPPAFDTEEVNNFHRILEVAATALAPASHSVESISRYAPLLLADRRIFKKCRPSGHSVIALIRAHQRRTTA